MVLFVCGASARRSSRAPWRFIEFVERHGGSTPRPEIIVGIVENEFADALQGWWNSKRIGIAEAFEKRCAKRQRGADQNDARRRKQRDNIGDAEPDCFT